MKNRAVVVFVLLAGVLFGCACTQALTSQATYDEGIEMVSSYPSDDVEGGTDGTARITLQSYQRANYNSFGEVIRVFLMRNNAKGMEAYYIPKQGYNGDGSAKADLNSDGTIADISQWMPVSWTGAHFAANDGNSNHVHWSVEVPDSTGALQSRFEVFYGNRETGDIGLDKTTIATNLADFNVRCTNDQELRLSAGVGDEIPLVFSHDWEGNPVARRWVIRTTDAPETGNNAGSDFQVVRYGDDGAIVDTPLNLDRRTGNVTIGGGTAAEDCKLDVRGNAIRIATPHTPQSATDTGTPGQICWDEDYMYVCVDTDTWKRTPLESWD